MDSFGLLTHCLFAFVSGLCPLLQSGRTALSPSTLDRFIAERPEACHRPAPNPWQTDFSGQIKYGVPQIGNPQREFRNSQRHIFRVRHGVLFILYSVRESGERGAHQLPLVGNSRILISRIELQGASTRRKSVPAETIDTSPDQWYSGVGYAGKPQSKGLVISSLTI